MKLICPACRAIASAEAFQAEADTEKCLQIIAELPSEISRRVTAYLGLFRPLSGQRLRWSTALKLTIELQSLVADASIQWKQNPARPGSITAWAGAMERIIQSPPKRLPLKSHGYLRSIAWEIADDEDRAREVKYNQSERDGSLRRDISARRQTDDNPGTILSVEEMKTIRRKNMEKNN